MITQIGRRDYTDYSLTLTKDKSAGWEVGVGSTLVALMAGPRGVVQRSICEIQYFESV